MVSICSLSAVLLLWSSDARPENTSIQSTNQRIEEIRRPLEIPVPPPTNIHPVQLETTAATTIGLGRFTSVQVNVNFQGNNIVGDAANESSIAVDPTDSNKMAIGWRQFDTITNNFRQAGAAFTQDGGQTWTNNGPLTPGLFRSDPVLASDANGVFYYSSLSSLTSIEMFRSDNGGATWSAPVPAFGGDKQWIAIDRTSGIGAGNVYQIWNVQFSCCGNNDFTRSVNGGASFQGPFPVATPSMKWGTMDVGPDGILYAAGSTLNQTSHLFSRSNNAQKPSVTPVFMTQSVNLGGTTSFGSPNPSGLLGQVNIATDHSNGPFHNNIYVLGSVNPPSSDPLDVHFIRSVDGGDTFSSPIRVNDDAIGLNAYQWFGTMSVAPNGRIDVIWNDTRDDNIPNNPTFSALYYTYSLDAGLTWFPSEAVTPTYNHFLGYPDQEKMGDYYDMVSENAAAHLAYAATFTGGQDVYYVRLTPDCNDNGIADETDIANETSTDCNGNLTPDECESDDDCNNNLTPDICEIALDPSVDCDTNLILDECEIFEDCNTNTKKDSCDIADETSFDCNDNLVPDECEVVHCQDVIPPSAAIGELAKSRYISIVPENDGVMIALQVTLLTMPSPYESTQGETYWVDEPFDVVELDDPLTVSRVSLLTCDPVFRDWSDVSLLHITGTAIIPDAQYEVRAIPLGCIDSCVTDTPLVVATGDWGDVKDPFATKGGSAQPSISDVLALVDKWLGSNDISVALGDLEPRLPNQAVEIADILKCVDAWLGVVYPLGGPILCP